MSAENTRKRILIAEDEKPLSKVLSLKLTGAGYDVVIASNGEEALELISKEKFDLFLLDLVMPKLGGFEVLEGMKKSGIKIHTAVLSNLSQQEDVAKAISLGASDFFIKSDTPISEIIEYVANALKK